MLCCVGLLGRHIDDRSKRKKVSKLSDKEDLICLNSAERIHREQTYTLCYVDIMLQRRQRKKKEKKKPNEQFIELYVYIVDSSRRFVHYSSKEPTWQHENLV